MRQVRQFSLLFLLLAIAHISVAQNSIFAGKITDENGKPVDGATIIVSRAGNVTKAISDNDGLYFTQVLESGNYHMDIVANGKYVRVRKIFLAPAERVRRYYNIKVSDKNAVISISEQEPFIATKIARIEAEGEINDFDFPLRKRRRNDYMNGIYVVGNILIIGR